MILCYPLRPASGYGYTNRLSSRANCIALLVHRRNESASCGRHLFSVSASSFAAAYSLAVSALPSSSLKNASPSRGAGASSIGSTGAKLVLSSHQHAQLGMRSVFSKGYLGVRVREVFEKRWIFGPLWSKRGSGKRASSGCLTYSLKAAIATAEH